MQDDNQILNLASKFINSTSKNIFLTGKAGTGKTTFLRNVVKTTHKKNVVAAPTGIAAINAGGVTLHSLFQLPFGVFIPTNDAINEDLIASKVTNPRTLLRELRINETKRKLIREIELLIIDEVSMLRADTLDAIDLTLKTIRRNRIKPFGGVQVLFIGDMQQLPPVVTNQEKPLLQKFYKSPYFFDAKVFESEKPVYIELEHIFRQTDKDFISLLNHIRDNILTKDDLNILNQHYQPNLDTSKAKGYVNLTTHNYLAEQINQQELDKLNGTLYSYDAQITGDFDESTYPVEYTLKLKAGAQVMLIKNDYSSEQRYFNGKIGKIESLENDSIIVSFDDGSPSVEVEPYTWRNKRYTLNRVTNDIEEVVIGTFTHYPLKLAWAITIHKSQGLTFQKAIIDVSRAFAPGQIYVALSRLVSLKGLIITRQISPDNLYSDLALTLFSQTKNNINELPSILEHESVTYITDFMIGAFDFRPILANVTDHIQTYDKDASYSSKQQFKQWATDYLHQLAQYADVASKFTLQLKNLTQNLNTTTLTTIKQRVEAAIAYFDPILVKLSDHIDNHITVVKNEFKVKAYLNELSALNGDLYARRLLLQKALALITSTLNNDELTLDKITKPTTVTVNELVTKKKLTGARKKGSNEPSTYDITHKLALQGDSIEEIAIARGMSTSTIAGHIAKLIVEGKLERSNYIDPIKYEQILQVSIAINSNSISKIRQKLGNEFSYDDIRIALTGRNNKPE